MRRRIFDVGALGPLAGELADVVRGILRSSDSERERVAASIALWRIAGDAEGLGCLIGACADLVRGRRVSGDGAEVLRALGEFGAEARAGVPVLRELAESGRGFGGAAGWRGLVADRMVRTLAADALRRVG
ncbi:hypothetical protein OG216_15155 [Streptomycetaceae bacterium NBC_01309]